MSFCYKDFLVMRKQLVFYGAFVVIYTGMVLFGMFSVDILPGLAIMVGMMAPLSSIAYDDQARWDKFAACTPGGKGGIVKGKYLFAALLSLGASLLVLALQLVLVLLGLVEADLLSLPLVSLICFGVSLLLNAVLLPLILKFGAEKSRIISICIFVVIFAGIFLVGRWAEVQGGAPALPPWLLSALPLAGALLVLGGYVLSYCIARVIYEKKEL
ncbi:MAG: ABC-2 transporter permease [Pseudoflavonifractor sp.]